MAASAEKRDYVHIIIRALTEDGATPPKIMIKDASAFERKYKSFDIDRELKDVFGFGADLVIIALGENVPAFNSLEEGALFKKSLKDVLVRIKKSSDPLIVVKSCFWANKDKDKILREVCSEVGGRFVDISQLCKDESNFARSERDYSHKGVAAHPGDKGMQAIADAILGGINAGAVLAKSRLVENLEKKRAQRIVMYGTSLTAAGSWVKQLDAILQDRYPGLVTVVNSGGSGKWSDWGVANVEERVIKNKPDTVFIEFCINDSVARFKGSVKKSRANLNTMVNRILKSNSDCEIILMTMTPGNKYPEGHFSYRKDIADYYEMYRLVAKERGFMLIDLYPEWKELQKNDPALFLKYVPDTIHPTAVGCAEMVTPVIVNALNGEIR
jgi:lysophospholipase L1-like esterase